MIDNGEYSRTFHIDGQPTVSLPVFCRCWPLINKPLVFAELAYPILGRWIAVYWNFRRLPTIHFPRIKQSTQNLEDCPIIHGHVFVQNEFFGQKKPAGRIIGADQESQITDKNQPFPFWTKSSLQTVGWNCLGPNARADVIYMIHMMVMLCDPYHHQCEPLIAHPSTVIDTRTII